MVLSDGSIRQHLAAGSIVIDPLDPGDVQPASVDPRLGGEMLVFSNYRRPHMDVRGDLGDLTERVPVAGDAPFILHPGEFVLGATREWIDLVARLEGKSSLGRLGLVIHSTAGFVDPGWKGRLTLELSNLARLPVTLYGGMKIGRISFLRLDRPAERLYGDAALGSKYQGQGAPESSRFSRELGG